MLTVLAVLLVLFGPIQTTSTSNGSTTSGLVDDLNFFAMLLLIVVTLAGFATGLASWGRRLGLVGLSSVVLCLGVVISLPSIGLFFLPAAVATVGTWISLYRSG
ncbi:hypothetical protein EF847_21970 [Actinobacteria bacterium YIM 96077]|uniref:Uncharacterized protein n=1 Tax=Phytoactinopolyspora halophila TaxID=1981511 RepID=A0A329QTR8_9ACTN|nr:hypothetical protein EF847_21970 [Actinobacteria bacterium YIM 96077]RAW15416.1 hypothetical protein DPM12_09200 [Phytoactinopolyspora halophila]